VNRQTSIVNRESSNGNRQTAIVNGEWWAGNGGHVNRETWMGGHESWNGQLESSIVNVISCSYGWCRLVCQGRHLVRL